MKSVSILLLFSAVGCLIYADALDNPFQFDDHHSVEYNAHIRSLANIPGFFVDLHTFSGDRRGAMFRPLLMSSFALNYALHGSDVRGYRAFNLLLHLLCSWLVFMLIGAIGGRREIALVGGFIFLLHPTHAEAVNYISSRSDLLVGCLYLASTCLLIGAIGQKRLSASHTLGGLLAYSGGLLSKSVAITLPVIIAGYGFWREGREQLKRHWRIYTALSTVSLAYLAIITFNRFLPGSIAKMPRALHVHLWTQLKAFVYYLWLFVMPVKLNVDHQFVLSQSPFDPVPILAGLLLLSLGIFAVWGRRRLPGLGYMWFVLVLLPASFMPLNILVSERRMYLASAGLVFGAAWAWSRLAQKYRRSAFVVGAGLCLVFAVDCMERNAVWATQVGLWEDAVEKGPGMFRARTNLALAYVRQDREQEALEQLHRALEINANFADAWAELGIILERRGAGEKAEAAYRRALEIRPDMEGVYYNLGTMRLRKGRRTEAVDERRDLLEEAINYYDKCIERDPDFADAYNNRGQAYEALGQLERAVEEYRSALRQDREQPQGWYNLAAAQEKQGHVQEAVRAYGEARDLLYRHPDYSTNAEFREFARLADEAIQRLQGD